MERPYVSMEATIALTISAAAAKLFYPGAHINLDIGGFEFECCGKPIQFDFDVAGCSITDRQERPDGTAEITLVYQSGCGPFFNEHHTADYYDDENWGKHGFTPSDITAEFLSKADRAIEFHMEFSDSTDKEIEVKSAHVSDIIFTDGTEIFPAKMGAFNVTLPCCTCD